jgi:hypothetical protein
MVTRVSSEPYFRLRRLTDVHVVRVQCRWNVNDAITADPSHSTLWQSVDISFTKISKPLNLPNFKDVENIQLLVELSESEHHQLNSDDFGSTEASAFVLDCISRAVHENESFARIIVPNSMGYIVRSDIIPLRLLDCQSVDSVAGFSKPLQYFQGGPIGVENLRGLPNAFARAVGGLLLKSVDQTGSNTVESLLKSLDLELQNRLSFSWLSEQAPKPQILAIVDGGISGPDSGGTGGSIYTAAAALGIDMVVFDSPNHWVNGPRHCHWRKATVPLECPLEPEADFVGKIVDAVRSYKGQIDGIVTFRDHYKLFVSEAALQLSLPTYPPSSYDIATDKFKTSVFEGHQAYRASDAEEASRIVQERNLEFPLIIKPTNGFLSEGVFRVENLAQLEAGVRGINTERHGKDFVIEKYCQGPEVDANFILCDGELLFFEASDDFPKTGDANGQGTAHSFIELANVLPSKLPDHELAILRDSLHQSLLRMGFYDGFYHLEARVENSSMEYATTNNVLDLTERSIPAQGAPSAWLIEVNPRPPGIQASDAVKHTYGLDYFGLALLFAVNDKLRVRQLSHPWAQGAQYWCEMVFIPVEKGGVYQSGNICVELLERRPDLAAHVSGSFCFLNTGDEVKDPSTGINSWVAYFIVYSRKSRADVLEIADCVRREVQFSIV